MFGSSVRVTSIEAFHLHSSNADWPNCVTSRYHFQGSIDVELAKKAWRHCLGRQKHASWNLQSGFGSKWKTESLSEEALNELADGSFNELVLADWPDQETDFNLDDVNNRGLPDISARDRKGFNLWCIRSKDNDKATLIFAADHMLADGAAAIGFVREWMLAYNNLSTGNPIDRGLVKLDWERWKSRSRLGLLKWSFLKFLPLQVIGIFGATKFIFRKFSTVDPKAESSLTVSHSPGILGKTIAPEIVAELNDRADRLGVSSNSLLMTILFRALKRVRSAIETEKLENCLWNERKWIRLVLPISIRGLADRKLPCANKASIVQIERTFDQVTNADAATQSIDREVRIIMGFKLDHVFLIAIRMASVVPGLLKWVSSNQKSRGTAVFTNLGEPFRKTRACDFRTVGDLELIDYDLCGPIRSGTPLNIVWSTFRRPVKGQQTHHGRISMNFDRLMFSTNEARIILDAFDHELQDVAQFGGSTG